MVKKDQNPTRFRRWLILQANRLYFGVFCTSLCLITIATFTNTKCHASEFYSEVVIGNHMLCHHFALRLHHHFLCITSWTISAFKRSSAYIFLILTLYTSNKWCVHFAILSTLLIKSSATHTMLTTSLWSSPKQLDIFYFENEVR